MVFKEYVIVTKKIYEQKEMFGNFRHMQNITQCKRTNNNIN